MNKICKGSPIPLINTKTKLGRAMKLTSIALFVFSTGVCASVHSQNMRVNIHLNNTKTQTVLEEIEKQTDYLFIYNTKEVDLNREVSVSAQDETVSKVLSAIFDGTNISYAMEGSNIMLMEKPSTESAPQQDTRQITGTVVDAAGVPVIGANVMVKGTTNGTITDIDGKFMLEVAKDAILQVSYIGYTNQEIPVGNQSVLKIALKEDTQALDEVVVVGYGTMKKKLVTGATVQVKGDEITQKNTSTVLDALKGLTPGVNIQKVSAQPGDGFKINIRGLGTIGNSSPLFLVDGVTVPNIDNLNPSDIESVDVLKDASSAAIYGARAANGVVLITTRQGKKGKTSISYDGYYGIQNNASKVNYLNGQDYLMLMSEYYTNNGMPIPDYASQIPGYENIKNGTWNGTNWLKETTNKNAPIQNHSLNVTGGGDKALYSLGLSYDSQEGIVGKPAVSTYDRYTFRINTDFSIIKHNDQDILKVGENFNFSYSTRNAAISEGSANQMSFAGVASGCPVIRAYNPDPTNQGPYDTYFPYDVYGGPVGIAPTAPNPLAYLDYAKSGQISKNTNLNGNVYLILQPIKNLTFRSSFGINGIYTSSRSFVPAYCLTAITSTSYYVNNIDKTTQSMRNGIKWMFENTLNYKFSLGENQFDVLLGTSAEKDGIGETISGSNGYSLFDSFEYAYLVNNKMIDPAYTTLTGAPLTPNRLLSYFGRVNYDYKQTYMLSVVFRADGSSNFAPNHRWGYFPSFSVGWAITNEKFMDWSKGWLDYFKLRASWGQNGNQAISPFQYLSTISFSGANYYYSPDKSTYLAGGYPNVMSNPDVTWETSIQTDLGFDARLLSGRLGINFDWYNKITKDWLIQAPILATDGTGAPYINGGDVRNRGIEVAFSWNDQIGDFQYSISPNFSFQSNEVTRIANPEGIIHGPTGVLHADQGESFRAQVGYPIGYFWGLETNGLFQNEQEVQNYVNNEGIVIQPSAQPGDLRYVDQNGDGAIDQNDNVMLGDPNPNFVYGLTMNFSYKGFDLNISANGVMGNQVMWNYFNANNHGIYNWMDFALERWHGEGTSNTYPRINIGSIQDIQMSDRFVADADYLRLSNLTLGYDFNRLWEQSPLTKLRGFISVQNLFTLTSYKGFNPEVGNGGPNGGNWAGGVDTTPYPIARTVMFGVSINY